MRWNITFQLLVPFLLVLLGVVAVGTWASWAAAERAAWQQTQQQMRDAGRVLAQATFPLTEQVLQQVKGLSGLELVWSPSQGTTLGTLPAAAKQTLPEVPVTERWQELQPDITVQLDGQSYRACRLHIQAPGRPTGTLLLLHPEHRWQEALRQAHIPAWAFGGIGGVVAIGAATVLSRRMARRMQVLVRQTQAIAGGDFHPAPLPRRNDEWTDLGKAINAMAEQLARYRDALQQAERLRLLHQLSSGLVHHLRNGLTGARLAVQLHLKETGDQTEPLQVALRQLTLTEERLRRIVDLSRTDAAPAESCDLAAMTTEAVALLSPQSRHLQTPVRWMPPGEIIPVRQSRSQTEHLLLNIIGNAIDAAGTGGEVTVHVSRQTEGREALLEVEDTGPGPSPELADRLFDPFVTGKPEGIGLGLTAAKQAAEQAGGSIRWFRRDNRTVFAILLPCADASPSQEQG